MYMADFSSPLPAPWLGVFSGLNPPSHVWFRGTQTMLSLKALRKNDFVPWRYVKLAG